MADTPVIREELTQYYAEVAKLDELVGDVLDMLEKNGLEKNTLVLFSSEQGWQFPGCKYSCWDQGLHTALIARWPGHIKAGSETDALVQLCDILPTFIDLAGGTPDPKEFDGRSLVGVLTENTDKHRDYVYGIHNNVPDGEPYAIRTIYDGTYRYVENLTPDVEYVGKGITGTEWFASMKTAAANGDEHAALIVQRTSQRPAEELYRTNEDPYELNNLASNPEYSQIKKKLSEELDAWRKAEKDPGSVIDSKEYKNKKR